jgi:hypothetical protein
LSERLARQGDALFLRTPAHPFVTLVADLLTFLFGAGGAQSRPGPASFSANSPV